MRGKALFLRDISRSVGITPAYAGKRRFPSRHTTIFGDHPRLCGEKADYFGVTTDYLGSPPPMRGKGVILPVLRKKDGITPAYAGKS